MCVCMYIYIYISTYTNIPRNTKVRLYSPWHGDSHSRARKVFSTFYWQAKPQLGRRVVKWSSFLITIRYWD